MASTPAFVSTPRITPQSWTNSDAANTKKTIFTAGANGSKVTSIVAASSDSTARVFQIFLNRSSTSYLLGSATVPITSGADGSTPSTNLLGLISGLPKDNDGQVYLFLENGDILQANNVTQVTSAKEVDLSSIGADF